MTAITTLELTAFGKFRNKKIELNQGLNEFYHHNEWGKSTVCDFIMFMLYGVKALGGKKLTLDDKHLEKYLPWSDDGYISGSLELLRDGDLFRIERRVTARGSGRLAVYKNGDLYDCPQPGREFFGADKDTFMRTFLVRQTDIRFERTADIEVALHNLVTTGDENVSLERAMKTLDKLQTPIQSQKQRGSGRIPALYGEISSAELELASLCREKTVVDARLSELDGLTAELASLNSQSAALDKKSEVASGNEAMRLICELDAVDGEIVECRSRLGGSPLTQIEKEYMQNAFSDRTLAKTAAEQAARRVADTRFFIDNAKNGFADYDTFEKNTDIIARLVGDRARPNTALVVAGALAAVAGVALGIFVSPFCLALTLLGAVVALLGATVLKRSVRVPAYLAQSHAELIEKYRAFTALRDKLGSSYVHLEVYEKEYNDAQARLAGAEAAIAKISKDYGIDSAERLMSRLAADGERGRTEAALQRLYRKRADLLTGRDEADIRSKALKGDGSDLTPSRLAQLKLAVSEKAAVISQRLTALEGVRVERERIQTKISELTVTAVRLKNELEACEYKNAVYTQVREALTIAGEHIKGSYNPMLAKRVSPVLSALTGGKYTDVYVDKEFGVRVKSEGEYRELGYFSRGTADCVYFAIRLCMADILCKDAPLILDDPFWSLDGDRLQNALSLINKISESKQVVLFGAR